MYAVGYGESRLCRVGSKDLRVYGRLFDEMVGCCERKIRILEDKGYFRLIILLRNCHKSSVMPQISSGH